MGRPKGSKSKVKEEAEDQESQEEDEESDSPLATGKGKPGTKRGTKAEGSSAPASRKQHKVPKGRLACSKRKVLKGELACIAHKKVG